VSLKPDPPGTKRKKAKASQSEKAPAPLCFACERNRATPGRDELTVNGAAPEAGRFCDTCRARLADGVTFSEEERAAVRITRLYGVPLTSVLLKAATRALGNLYENGLLLPGIERREVKQAQSSIRDDEEQAAEDRAKAEGRTLADLAREEVVGDSTVRMRSYRRKKRLKARR
jgi:hypothetical protein